MVIASFLDFIEASGWKILPRTRYVLGESIFRKIEGALRERLGRDPILSHSCANSYERRYAGQPLDGRRLAIYRENAFGDGLFVTALTRYVKERHPECEIDVHSVPALRDVWVHNSDVRFAGIPLSFEALKSADYHLLLEGMIENDSEPEQQNVYDSLFDFAGIPHFHVPDESKRPHIQWGPGDEDAMRQWKSMKPWKYVLWHVTPSSAIRMYPPELQSQAIEMIAETHDVVLVGKQENSPRVLIDHPRVHDWTQRTGNWRALLPMIREASCVVAPDSSVMHATAAFPDVPLVGLWGPFASQDRAKYYANHIGVDAHRLCPYSPCRPQRNEFPRHKCASAINYSGPDEQWCCALSGISFERIAAAVVGTI